MTNKIKSEQRVIFTAGNGREIEVEMSGNCLLIRSAEHRLMCKPSEDFEHRLLYIWADKYIGKLGAW